MCRSLFDLISQTVFVGSFRDVKLCFFVFLGSHVVLKKERSFPKVAVGCWMDM